LRDRISFLRPIVGIFGVFVLVAVARSLGASGAIFSDQVGFEVHFQAGTWACTYTQGYWKNHPDAWPVDVITVGNETYSKDEAVEILRTPPEGNATIILAHQLIAAKLNGANGVSQDAIGDTIADADAWLTEYPLGSNPSGLDREQGVALAEKLDSYNNGLLGPGPCEDETLALEPLEIPNPDLCTFSMDYWKDHPARWPAEAITVGGVTYTKADALAIFNQLGDGDVTTILARQLISSVLNLLNGADTEAIENIVIDADQWLMDHPSGSKVEDGDREIGLTLAETLDAYNDGMIGPGACEDGEKTVSSTETSKAISTTTPTATDTSTATLTDTPEPTTTNTPTDTTAPAEVPPPTETPTATPTDTPTATATYTPTDTSTPTDTTLPTETSTATPTETPTVTVTLTPDPA
jgi:hypothetical protein